MQTFIQGQHLSCGIGFDFKSVSHLDSPGQHHFSQGYRNTALKGWIQSAFLSSQVETNTLARPNRNSFPPGTLRTGFQDPWLICFRPLLECHRLAHTKSNIQLRSSLNNDSHALTSLPGGEIKDPTGYSGGHRRPTLKLLHINRSYKTLPHTGAQNVQM